jgi:hypothetical protein
MVWILTLLLCAPCTVMASVIDLSLSDSAAIYSAVTAGYKGDRARLIEVGREREALYLARGMVGECYEGDIDCALGAVGVTVMTRAAIASSPGVAITPGEILATLSQYPGFTASRLSSRREELKRLVKRFLPVARFVIAGGLNGRYPPSTHYAREEVLIKTSWGKSLINAGYSFYRLPDEHLVLVGTAPFRKPHRGLKKNYGTRNI